MHRRKKTQENYLGNSKTLKNFDNNLLPQNPFRNENNFLVDKDISFKHSKSQQEIRIVLSKR